MFHSYAQHYRNVQKKLFTGESLVLFMASPGAPSGAPGGPETPAEPATPGAPATPATPGTPGTPVTPGAPATPATPGTPGAPVPTAPAEQTGQGNPEAILSSGLDVQAKKRLEEKMKVTEFMKELVPERTSILPGEHIDVRESWMELMGEYNGVQSQINALLEYKKKFTNPEELKKDPNFRKTYKTYYESLVQIRYLQSMDLGGVDWADLEKKASGEFTAKTADVIRDTDKLITQLVSRRKMIWGCIEGRIHDDFGKRLQNLKTIWSTNPPKGYEAASGDWLKYLEKIEGQVKSHHFEDTDNAEHPQGDKYFDELKALWSSIADSESTVSMWRDGQEHDISIPKLLADLDSLEQEKKAILTPEFKHKYEQAIDDVAGPLEKVIRQMKEKGATKKELEKVEETLEALKGSRDIESQLDAMINSTEPQKELVRAGTTFIFPKGLRKQVEFLTQFPLNDTESKHMLYRMQDAIREARVHVKDLEKYTAETLPNYLLKVKLQQEKMNQPTPKGGRKLMWISGPQTYSVLKHTVTELFERSWKRDNDRKAGIFGKEAFSFLGDIDVLKKYEFLRPLSEVSSEADTHREHAETEGFQHYEKVHEHLAVEHMIHKLHETDNEFEFRGLIGLLCKKGRMRWDDVAFFKQLNKFQKRIHVPENLDIHMANRVESEDQMKEAIFGIYEDVDIYRDWVAKNASSLKSEKQSKSARYGELSEQDVGGKSALKVKIEEILKKYKSDMAKGEHFSDADPVEYEAILDYAIAQGKLDNEDIDYFMIQGIGSGHLGQPGLLSLDRASEMTGQNNSYPAIELFAEATKRGAKPTLADVQEWAEMTHEEYVHWYHSYVMYLPKVQQRLNKAQSQGMKMDHDYFTGTAAYLNGSSIEGMLRANESGGYGLQVTAVQNGSVGMLFGLDVLAEEYSGLGDSGKNTLSRMVDMVTRFDGILNGRMHRKESNYMRLDYTSKEKDLPRYAAAYTKFFGREKTRTTGNNLETMKNYFRILDHYDPNFPLFSRLFENGFADDAEAMTFAQGMMVAHPGIFGDGAAPQGIDGLYQAVGAYVAFIAKERPDIVQEMNAKIIADHRSAGKSIDGLKAHREHEAQAFRQKYADQIKNGPQDHGHGGHAHSAHGAHGDEHGDDHGGHGGHGGGEHPAEGHGAAHGAAGGGAHGDDHGAAAAAHAGATHASTH